VLDVEAVDLGHVAGKEVGDVGTLARTGAFLGRDVLLAGHLQRPVGGAQPGGHLHERAEGADAAPGRGRGQAAPVHVDRIVEDDAPALLRTRQELRDRLRR